MPGHWLKVIVTGLLVMQTLKRRAMKLSDFILSGEEEKKKTVLHEGVLLAKRDNEHCKIFLFGLGDYYVEMFCNRQSKAIEEYRAFDNMRLLSPYLQAISLDDLLK
jgi:hypothetical protein